MSNNPYIEIRGRKIGVDYDPLVIAEIGINHGGSLKIAFEMVDAAASVGIEIVKHQTHIVEDEMTAEAKNIIPGNANVSIYKIMEECALSEEDEIKLKNYVESKGMIFISTPFSRAAANRLQKMDVPAYKIGSGECNNYPLIKHIASFGKPIILSTGMNTIDSIEKAVSILRLQKIPYALLHTTNVYPTAPHLIRLGALNQLSEFFPDAVIGLSDHSITNIPCLGAVALGASILERHFTDSMDRSGPDIVCSMDALAAKELINSSKIMKQARGGFKSPIPEETATINFAYASVCTIKPIKAGESFTIENIWVKRPGTGEIKAGHFEDIIGKSARIDIENDALLMWEMVK